MHHLKIASDLPAGAKLTCYLNGFPVYTIGSGSTMNATPIDLYLIGKDNKLTVQIEGAYIGSKVKCTVSLYAIGEYVDPEDQRESIVNLKLENESKKEALFSNENADFFGRLLKHASSVSQAEALNHAAYIHQLNQQKNGNQLAEERSFYTKLHADYYGEDYAAQMKQTEHALTNIFMTQPLSDKAEPSFTAISYCDGKLWHLKLNGKELLRRGDMTLTVYVAKIDGKLWLVL